MKKRPPLFPAAGRTAPGFTLVELVLIIVLVSILAAVALVRWPTDMREEAASRELKRAIRLGQHLAMTRAYQGPASAWGIVLRNNRYSVQRADGSADAGPEFRNRALLNDPGLNLTGPDLRFNGLGEPITVSGGLLGSSAPRTFTVNGIKQLTVCAETGFVREGPSCP